MEKYGTGKLSDRRFIGDYLFFMINEELISRYLRSEVTETEQQAIEEWITIEGASWMDQFIEAQWNSPAVATPAAEKDSMADKVVAALAARRQPVPVLYLRVPVRALWLRRIAAACLLIITGALGWQQWQHSAATSRELTWQTIRNETPGGIRRVYLPDSSLVMMNAGSVIRFANNYNDTSRELELTGEAFFEVRHNTQHPFRVHAGMLVTRVYGTVFNITAYPEASELRIALKKGSIGVRRTNAAEQMLQPGELLLYNKAADSSYIDHLPVEEMGAWTHGTLAFYKTPVKDVLSILEQQYGVTFVCDTALRNKTITASFDKVPLKQVLHHLSFVWNMQFQQEKNTIHVR